MTVSMKNMEIECEAAKQDPSLEMKFRRDFLCQWTNVETKWLPMDKYDKCGEPFDPAALEGKVCYGGLDLASSDDIAAFVLVFPPQDGDESYYILPFFWIPRDNMERRVRKHHVPYDKWERLGFLNTTEGNIIHYDFIEQKIEELSHKYLIKEICYDEWGAIQMSQNLTGRDFEMVPFRQGFRSFSAPSKEMYRLILDERIRHGGNPALRWMFENVCIETDAAANIKPSKNKSREKIDGVVAAIMALDRAIRREDKKKPQGAITVYDGYTDTFISSRDAPAPTERKTDANGQRQYTWRELEDGY